MSPPSLSSVAHTGFSSASDYDAYRPSYNPVAVSHFLAALNLTSNFTARILEIGSGTGKFTSLLATHDGDRSYEILAIEPHSEMAKVLRTKALPGIVVKEGNAHAIPVEEAWADVVIAAQAFHWFATRPALDEFARVLRPHSGTLGFIWNIEDYNQSRSFACATAWESALRDLNWVYTTDSVPRYKDGKWRDVFEVETDLPFRVPIQEKLFREIFWLTKESLWRRLNTLSNIVNQSAHDKVELRKMFDGILENATDLIQNKAGEIAVHSTCITAWTILK